ncbi:partial Protein translocase subunit SecF, partial [Planctomycetaceae bacterium]
MELFNPNSNIDFLSWRKVSMVISAILVIGSLVLLGTRGLNYALDFTGGVLVEVTYKDAVQVDQVRSALEAGGFEHAQVQSLGGTRDVAIRLQPRADQKDAEQVGKTVMDALQKARSDATLKRHPDLVGSSVGAELRSDGIVAAVFVMIGIMIYIGIRFEKRFAIAAIASEIHDTILTVGFFSLTQMEFDLTVLA